MRTLVLGGTAWLGRTVARHAQDRGARGDLLARGESGRVAEDVTLVTADRRSAGAYDAVSASDWDLVVEVSWQPDMVRSALAGARLIWSCDLTPGVVAGFGFGEDFVGGLGVVARPLDHCQHRTR